MSSPRPSAPRRKQPVPDDLSQIIASQVRRLRTAQGLTLEVLANRSGMPIETLSRIERRRIAPSIRSLARVADGLGVPLVALLGVDEVKIGSGEGIPLEVRGIALKLVGRPAKLLDQVRRIIDVLTDAASARADDPSK